MPSPADVRRHGLAYVASMPADVLDRLRRSSTRDAIGLVLDLERWCDERRDAVSDLLFRAVATASDGDERRRLLAARRALYNRRVSPAARAACAGANALTGADREVLLAYCDRVAELRAHERSLQRAVSDEIAQAVAQLPAIADAHPPLLDGVALVSPDLYRAATAALARRRAAPASDLPPTNAEVSLTLYLLRAVTKTAGYSTFTAIAPARWSEVAGPPLRLAGGGLGQRRVAALNRLPLTVLRRALTAAEGWPSSVNPYCTVEEDAVRTVRTSALAVRARSCAFRKVELVSLRCDPALRAALGDRDASRLPDGLTRSLLDLQVLVPAAVDGLEEDSADGLAAILDARPPAPGTPLADVRADLRHASDVAFGYGGLGAPERAAAVEHVDRALRAALRAAGVEPTPDLVAPPLYERAELADAAVELSRPAWRPVLRDLGVLGRALPLWDVYEPLRPMLTAHFVDRFGPGGRCRDVLSFLIAGHDRGAGGLRPEAIMADGLGWWFAAAGRGSARADLLSGLCALVQHDPEEVEVDAGWLAGLAAGSGPGTWHPTRCDAYHGHVLGDAAPRLVLNVVTDGWGKHAAQHGVGAATGAGAEELPVPPAPPGHEYVELSGTFGFNANAHRPLTRRQLLMPGDGSRWPSEARIHLTDLELVHDVGAGRLRLVHRRDGMEIHPLYLGLLTPALLGPLHQALLPFTQVSWTDLPVAELAHRALDRRDATGSYPRVRLGSIVLSRRKWIVPARQWPEWPRAQAVDATALLELERWRRRLGFPNQVYVRPVPTAEGRMRHRKPQFVDFRSAFVVAAVSRRMRFDSGWVVVEEALPAPGDYAASWAGRRYASSLVVETRSEGAEP